MGYDIEYLGGGFDYLFIMFMLVLLVGVVKVVFCWSFRLVEYVWVVVVKIEIVNVM